jgi:predicted solute-binding protein
LANVEQILKQHAVPRGWPIDTARQYLTQNLKFNIGPRQIEAIKLFYELAAKNGVIDGPVRELVVI